MTLHGNTGTKGQLERDLNVSQKWLEKSAAQPSVSIIKVAVELVLGYCCLLLLEFVRYLQQGLLLELRVLFLFWFCFVGHYRVAIVGMPLKRQHVGLSAQTPQED